MLAAPARVDNVLAILGALDRRGNSLHPFLPPLVDPAEIFKNKKDDKKKCRGEGALFYATRWMMRGSYIFIIYWCQECFYLQI